MAIEGRIAILGGGNMGSALVKGLIAGGTATVDQIVVAEKLAAQADKLRQELGVTLVDRPAAVGAVETLIVAVKPQDFDSAVKALDETLADQALVITLAAGVTLKRLAGLLPQRPNLVRAMPNTPALVGKGVTALAPAVGLPDSLLERARAIFAAVGQVVTVKESLMDAVTGLSGSGPGYAFLFMEALIDAGVAAGLDRATARTLAVGTVAGAAELIMQSGQHPAALKDMVTSPAGTTITGIQVLERGGLRGLVMDAVVAATARSRELGA